LPDAAIADEPAAPGVNTSIRTARTTSTPIAATMPRGMDRAGSRASSAASGTLSTARKNQIAKGNAAHTPISPYGRNAEAPAASVGAMSSSRSPSNCGIAPIRNTTSPASATTVTANIALSASPTPMRWIPTNSA
jgi:hypothetical protein